MTQSTNSITEATFIDAPHDADPQALFQYWRSVAFALILGIVIVS